MIVPKKEAGTGNAGRAFPVPASFFGRRHRHKTAFVVRVRKVKNKCILLPTKN
jgi:hypothetical protein